MSLIIMGALDTHVSQSSSVQDSHKDVYEVYDEYLDKVLDFEEYGIRFDREATLKELDSVTVKSKKVSQKVSIGKI